MKQNFALFFTGQREAILVSSSPTDTLSENDNGENELDISQQADAENQSEIDNHLEYQLDPELLEILGEEVPDSREKININAGVTKWWKEWMFKGLSDESRKEVVKRYPQITDFATDAPKINLEILRHMTDVAKKRDQHFSETQGYIGNVLTSLASAFSLITEDPEGDIDQTKLLKYLWDSGKLLSDVFFQQSMARRSFITPILDKDLKMTLEASVPDQWLYGEKLFEQVKEAKSIVKAADSLKQPNKAVSKKLRNKNTSQGNFRGPPAHYRQVGNFSRRRRFTNVRYKSRVQKSRPSSSSSKEQRSAPNKK